MRMQILELQANNLEARRKELDAIINKLYEYPIAMSDKHYDFLKELEEELREFKKNLQKDQQGPFLLQAKQTYVRRRVAAGHALVR